MKYEWKIEQSNELKSEHETERSSWTDSDAKSVKKCWRIWMQIGIELESFVTIVNECDRCVW